MSNNNKQTFSDIIGALVSGVIHARSVADIEALRIAYRYRDNELLKGMPIPRLRLKRVNISLPVIMTGLVPGTPPTINSPQYVVECVGSALADGINELIDMLGRVVRQENIDPNQTRRNALYERLFKFISSNETRGHLESVFKPRLLRAIQDIKDHNGTAEVIDAVIRDAVGEAADKAFTDTLNEATYLYIKHRVSEEGGQFDEERARTDKKTINEDEYVTHLKSHVRKVAEGSIIQVYSVPPDFEVTVNSDIIKNSGGGPDVVTRLSMSFIEEGLEWVTEVSHDGKVDNKLIPE